MKITRIARPAMIALIVAGTLSSTGCQAVKDAVGALGSFQKLQFKLGDPTGFQLAGVDISKLSEPSRLGIMDGAKLLKAFNSKALPVSFDLNVIAKNPNDGSSTTKSTNLFIKKFAWTLSIDDRTTINGVTNKRLMIPGTGQTETFPITMSLDLMKFFGDKGYDDLLNLAFAIGGVSGSSSRLKLTAKVTVETPLGDVTYPNDLTIVNTEFTNP